MGVVLTTLLSRSFGDIQVGNIVASCRVAWLIGSPGGRRDSVSQSHQVQECQASILGECLSQVSLSISRQKQTYMRHAQDERQIRRHQLDPRPTVCLDPYGPAQSHSGDG